MSAKEVLSSIPIVSRTGEPAHEQIQLWLARAIREGQAAPGERLPSERALASAFGVSRMTLRQALAELEQQGLIVRSRGGSGGSFVSQPTVVEVELTELVGLSQHVRRVNHRAGSRILVARTVNADDSVASPLTLPAGGRVHHVMRVRFADDLPVALEDSFFPESLIPDMLQQNLDGSMYELLSKYSCTPTSADEVVSVGAARVQEAEILGVARRSPVLRIERVAATSDGIPVEFSRDVFHPARVRFSVRSSLREDL